MSSKREIGELKAKLSKQTISQIQKSKETEIEKLKRELETFTSPSRQTLQEKEQEIAESNDRFAAFKSERVVKEKGIDSNASRQSVQVVKKGIRICLCF